MDAKENQKNLRAQDKRECNTVKISENESLAMRDSANYKTKEPRPENSESANDFDNNGKVTFSVALFVIVSIHIWDDFIPLCSRLGVIFSHCRNKFSFNNT